MNSADESRPIQVALTPQEARALIAAAERGLALGGDEYAQQTAIDRVREAVEGESS